MKTSQHEKAMRMDKPIPERVLQISASGVTGDLPETRDASERWNSELRQCHSFVQRANQSNATWHDFLPKLTWSSESPRSCGRFDLARTGACRQAAGMQIDATLMIMSLGVEFH
jgi:hypothetical protein